MTSYLNMVLNLKGRQLQESCQVQKGPQVQK